MTQWSCPLHGMSKIRVGKNGGQFCATKMPDGSWCPSRPPRDDGQQASVAPQASPSSDLGARYAAALQFSGLLYQGQGDEAVGKALKLAETIYNGWPR